jgi:hypothetical protein
VIVALVNLTLVTVGVHLAFGQAFWGATGSAVVTVKLALPFLTSRLVWEPVTLTVLVCPGATFPAGFVQVTVALPVAVSTTSMSWFPSPAMLPDALSVVPLLRALLLLAAPLDRRGGPQVLPTGCPGDPSYVR